MITSSGKKTASTQINSRASKLTGCLIQADGTNVATATIYDSKLGSVTLQNITITSLPTIAASTSNKITIEFVDGATAGAEVVTVTGNAIEVEIESGVSTATEVKAALDAESDFTAIASAATTGVASTAQVEGGPVRITGAEGDANILLQASVLGATRHSLLAFGDQLGVEANSGLYLTVSGTGASAIVYYRA